MFPPFLLKAVFGAFRVPDMPSFQMRQNLKEFAYRLLP